MSKELIKETAECCEDHSPMTYLGMCRIQQNAQPSFARALFTNRQIPTEMAYWDYMEDSVYQYRPEVMCDPCAKAPVTSVAEQFERRYAKPFTLKNRATVTCGEVKHQVMPGETADTASSWLTQFRDYMARKTLMQSQGFDKFEDELAWELLITQEINFPKTEYLPEGLKISYHRHEEMNFETSECFGKGQCDSMGIIEKWKNDMACGPNEDFQPTDILMHWCTWNDWKNSDDMTACLKSFNPQLFLGNQLLNQYNLEPVVRPKGVNLVYTDPNGCRYWTVNAQAKYKDETGATVKYDMMPKNKFIALDLSGGENSYSPEFIYTPIMDVCAALNEPEQINVARYAKTYTDCMNECWERRLTSNLMVALRCPNSTSCLTICAPKKAEAKVPAATTTPATPATAEPVVRTPVTSDADNKKAGKKAGNK